MTLFCDLDGVLADFEQGVEELIGKPLEDLSPQELWGTIARANSFFFKLNWMSDGQVLWSNITQHSPTILTGIPYGGWAAQQKRNWCALRLGKEIPVIPCWSKDKHTFAEEGDILIDDRLSAKDKWESVGGIFIHHTSAEDTLDELDDLL